MASSSKSKHEAKDVLLGHTAEITEAQVTLRLSTQLPVQYQLPTQRDFVVSGAFTKSDLNQLLGEELKQQENCFENAVFEYKSQDGYLLSGTLQALLDATNKVSEQVIELEYFLAFSQEDPELAAEAPSPIIALRTLTDAATSRLVAVCMRGDVRLFDWDSGDLTENKTIALDSDLPTCVIANKSHVDQCAVVCSSGLIQRLSLDGSLNTVALLDLPDPISCAALNEDAEFACFGSAEGCVIIYRNLNLFLVATMGTKASRKRHRIGDFPQVETPSPMHILVDAHPRSTVTNVRFLEIEEHRFFSVLSTGLDGVLKFWDFLSGSLISRFDLGKAIMALEVIDDHIITGHVDGVYKTWKIVLNKDGTSIHLDKVNEQKVGGRSITQLQASKLGLVVASITDDNLVSVMDVSIRGPPLVQQSVPLHAALRPEFPCVPTACCWINEKILAVGTSQHKIVLMKY